LRNNQVFKPYQQFNNHLKIKVMLIVLEVALFLAVIIVPLIPAKKVAK